MGLIWKTYSSKIGLPRSKGGSQVTLRPPAAGKTCTLRGSLGARSSWVGVAESSAKGLTPRALTAATRTS